MDSIFVTYAEETNIDNLFSRVGVSYYDSSIRQLHVLEVWEDNDSGFPLIDLGMYFISLLMKFSCVATLNLALCFLIIEIITCWFVVMRITALFLVF